MIGLIFKRLFGTKFVFDHHDLSPELYNAKFSKTDLTYQLLLRLERWTYRIADISLATNETYRRIAIERGSMAPEDVFLVRNGPDLKSFKIVPPVASLKHGREYLVGYVGYLSSQKGVHFLLQAASYIINGCCRSDVHFTIVGSGPELPKLRVMARDSKIEEYITFAGFLAHEDPKLLQILSTSDLCVCTLKNTQMNNYSTAMKIMEYMALGKPIVQFDLKEGRYSAQDAALYAEPDNSIDLGKKILELLDNPGRRAEMGRKGRERVESCLAWSHQAAKLLAAYEALHKT